MKHNIFTNKKILGLLVTLLFVLSGISVIIIVISKKPEKNKIVRLYTRASEAYTQGQFNETIEILRPLRKFPPALILIAKAFYFSDNPEKAEKAFKLALKYRPASFEAKLFLARIYYEKDLFEKAAQLAESLLADNPNDIQTLHLASKFAAGEGKDDEALIFLNRAAELSVSSAFVLLDRARMNWVSGRINEALEDLSRAKAMLPWDTPIIKSIQNLEKTIKEVM
ncbi:MAG: tetratricopeptide repeat protein [Treponema sp.]|jgi:tetratricopeptide (TPR) repeat protein|nr:tetratricopeptide repeat protein [Treponema sp.]